MLKNALANPYYFLRHEEKVDGMLEKNFFGCKQEWYQTDWQKQAGCGPTTACNILSYIEFSDRSQQRKNGLSKREGVVRMEESWKYVTPGENGIPSTRIFCSKFIDLAKVKGISVSCNVLDIYQTKVQRPDFEEVIEFINKAMLADSPVAFLNLCNGDEINLDEWHWVTIVSLTTDLQFGAVVIEIIDEGIIKKINLQLWYETTKLGGGFVYFR